MENFIVVVMVIAIALVVLSGGLPNVSNQNSTSTPINSVVNQNAEVKTAQNQSGAQNPYTQGVGIQTVGKEGNIAISLSQSISSGQNMLAGNTQVPFLGAQINAQNSDIDVQRVRVNLGSGSLGANFVSQVVSKIYILDSSYRVLASSPINQSTVNRESSGATSTYSITLAGFHFYIPQNTSKNLVVAFDINPVIDSVYRISYTISIDANGIRAVDGANISHTGPSSTISTTQNIVGGQSQNYYIN
jgi:hypothetical protein